ncbi:hypothetical protein V8F20_006653 [Naviculisporaceae sp. PSN 640]
MSHPHAGEQLLPPFHDYSQSVTPRTQTSSPEIQPEKFRTQTEATAYEPDPSAAELQSHPAREPRLFWFSGLVLILIPSTVAAYFWVTWLYLVYPDPDDPVKYARWDGSLVFYSWFIIGVFGLDWSKYGLGRAEAAMLQSKFWKVPNTASLLLHGDSSWSGPGGWLKYLKMTFLAWSAKRKGQDGSRPAFHNRLWLLLAFLSILPFIAIPLTGLSLEISDGYLYQSDPPMMIGQTWERFNYRQISPVSGYFDAALNAWSIATPPSIPGIGLLYTPEYLDRSQFHGSFEQIPNTFPLTDEGIPEVFVAQQAQTPVSGKVWGLRAGYNCSEVTDVSELTIVGARSSAFRDGGCAYAECLKLDNGDKINVYTTSTSLANNVWGYAEIGIGKTDERGFYNGSYPASFNPDDINRSGGTEILEYVLWQVQQNTTYLNELPPGVVFDPAMGTTGIRGLGHPIIQNTNGSFSVNETFFMTKAGVMNDTRISYLEDNLELQLPSFILTLALAPPIGFRCRAVSTLGEAYVDPEKSTFNSFQESPPPPTTAEAQVPRFGYVAMMTMLQGGYHRLFTSSMAKPRVSVSNSYFYRNFITPDLLQRSLLQAYAMDALTLMYDVNYGFEQAWENKNVTGSREGKVLTMGRVHPVIPAALLAAWAVGCAILGLWYGFRRRLTESLNGYSFMRIGVEVSDQVKENRDFWEADRFEESRTLQRLPGLVGDFKRQQG